ncbi:hypothetical protein ABZ918_10475 [Streptomyces viridosporus]|uniref:hypothetical protein n=1 Tax=Streptomyces viridosporus TaxID=67581 RepID=UPI003418F818
MTVPPRCPEELAAQISAHASRLAQRSDLAETADPRRVLYDLASALASLTGPIGTLVTAAGDYPDTVTGGKLAAPETALRDAVRAVHHLLGQL